ncbi:hypothetical protein ASB57_03305 [Bordetella sp. N]|nr:hypothetical protein ASB57_03305 [Bordetella sp. N]
MKPSRELRRARRAAACAIFSMLLLSGCVTQQVPPYQTSLANQIALSRLPPTTRANVDAVAGESAGTHSSVRVVKIAAPGEQSWSEYLVDAVRSELTTAGNFDATADTTIAPALISADIGDGKADASARFIVQRAGEVVYDKRLEAHTSWSVQFIGVLAVQDGLMQASAIFQTLVGKLFNDPDFIKTLAARPA